MVSIGGESRKPRHDIAVSFKTAGEPYTSELAIVGEDNLGSMREWKAVIWIVDEALAKTH